MSIYSERVEDRIAPRDIAPETLQSYWESVSGGINSLQYQWSDKPHRHVYDLIAYCLFLQQKYDVVVARLTEEREMVYRAITEDAARLRKALITARAAIHDLYQQQAMPDDSLALDLIDIDAAIIGKEDVGYMKLDSPRPTKDLVEGLLDDVHRLTREKEQAEAEAARLRTALVSELRSIAVFIRTPGTISRDDAIDECARVLENRARALMATED